MAPRVAAAPRFTGFPKEGLAWFRGLAMAQSRDWFQAHKAEYTRLWVEPMQALFGELAGPLARVHGRKLGAAKFFRLNRDVRFSKDKSPYKTNISAMFPFEGFAPMEGPAALYVHLGLDEVVAFGFYHLEPPQLLRLRKRVLDEKAGGALQRVVDAAAKVGLEPDAMETLKRAPVGIDPAHPRIELLRRKGLALSNARIPAKVRHGAALKDWVLEQAEAAAPLVRWGFQQKLLG